MHVGFPATQATVASDLLPQSVIDSVESCILQCTLMLEGQSPVSCIRTCRS